jgi:hypothetical protein
MDLPPIDPAEAILVVEGLGPFLRHSKRDMSGAIAAADALPATIGAKLYQFINREKAAEAADLPRSTSRR